MTKRMLIDATHAEETRVVVLDGNRLEDFDVETSGKKQLKGNIYLAKVVRVEPSLQAAFVEYGGNRHGFLAFGEIHPDYYQIPIADRQRLIALQAEAARAEQAAEEALDAAEPAAEASPRPARGVRTVPVRAEPPPALTDASVDAAWEVVEAEITPELVAEGAEPGVSEIGITDTGISDTGISDVGISDRASPEPVAPEDLAGAAEPDTAEPAGAGAEIPLEVLSGTSDEQSVEPPATGDEPVDEPSFESAAEVAEPQASVEEQATESFDTNGAEPPPRSIGGEHDTGEDGREPRIPMQYLRNYKIQEVIRRRQILLVQVVKEERGTKGAALTTFISLAGRFCVLMPNSPRGGGISRKITSAADRRRLKEITAELEIPEGMGMIVRTAGANRPKPEIKRDCEYLLRLWDDVRENTMRSVAPSLIHEEASLIKRAIRDVYSRDIEEIVVDGEEGWKAARDFMRMLMPSHAQKVIGWRDQSQPLFARHAVEAQLDAMMGKNVQLRSGGYLVIDQTEALVSIDVNSGRSTRERGIEETALRTNLEAADEVARQLRLRDLAGLIVIDFIDMESKKHNAMVERRLGDALKVDRARIQVGHISHFGLMEMSRQRLRPSLMEASLVPCPHCAGSGHVRSTESAAIHVLRGIEEEGAKRRNAEIMVHVAASIAMYILNHKRERLRTIEARYGMRVLFTGDNALIPTAMRIEKLRALEVSELPESVEATPVTAPSVTAPAVDAYEAPAAYEAPLAEPDEVEAPDVVEAVPSTPEARAEEEVRRRRRRRRRGPRRDDAADGSNGVVALDAEQPDLPGQDGATSAAATDPQPMDDLPESTGSAAFAPAPDAPVDEAMATAVTETPGTETTVAEPTAMPLAEAAAEAPSGDDGETPAVAADEDGEPRARRRGRRGGRRRRRDDGEEAPVEAVQPELPAYVGPTPADPFGNQPYDIFDMIDHAEQAALSAQAAPIAPAAPTPTPTPPIATDLPTQLEATAAPEPEPADLSGMPAHVSPDALAFDPHLMPESDPEPAASVPNGLHLVEPEATPEAVPEAAADPLPQNLVRPMLIDAPAAERKRGWWRR